jgi:DNA-binding MarR family transcriptional regulator
MEDALQIDQFLCFSVYAAEHAFNRFYRPLLDQIGLTYPQYLVMMSLWARDDQTVKMLGEALSLESSTLTPLLKRLEALAFISRARDTGDERQVRIRLTAKGRELEEPARKIPACVAAILGLSAQEAHDLREKLHLVQNRLRDATGKTVV